MRTEARVRRQIVQRLDSGQLPLIDAGDVIAGYGSGKPCAVCDQAIAPSEAQYDIEIDDGKLIMHIACYSLWQWECHARIKGSQPLASRPTRLHR